MTGLSCESKRHFNSVTTSLPLTSGRPGSPTSTLAVEPAEVGAEAQIADAPEVDADVHAAAAQLLAVARHDRIVLDDVERAMDDAGVRRDEQRRAAERPVIGERQARIRAERAVDAQLRAGARARRTRGSGR